MFEPESTVMVRGKTRFILPYYVTLSAISSTTSMLIDGLSGLINQTLVTKFERTVVRAHSSIFVSGQCIDEITPKSEGTI